MKSIVSISLGLLITGMQAFPQSTSATINVSTAQPTPLNSNFSGFNDEAAVPYEPYDPLFNAQAAMLSPGWIRYPGGIVSDAFDWQTQPGNLGLENPSWVSQFSSTNFYSTLQTSIVDVGGKGGQQFLDVGNQATALGAKVIVVVNGFTDTPASAGQMAAFALANNIPVAVWELSNEAYLFTPTFFASGNDYATKMKPYRDAIKAANPNAVVALFFSDPATDGLLWDKSLVTYTPQYWDAITYHVYGALSTGAFSQWMEDQCAVLYSDTSSYLTTNLIPLNQPGTKFLISEFNTTSDDLGQATSLTNDTLWGAVYSAEFIMRMSTVPQMMYVGMHAISAVDAVDAVNRNFAAVVNAYDAGTSIDTATLDFGYFLAAQVEGVAVLNSVLKNAVEVESTSVSGGATVPATGIGQIPALYAQGYANAAGEQSVVITNKSAVQHAVTIQVNGSPASGTFPVQYIFGTDPTTVNSSPTQMPVTILTATSSNPVPVMPYSVTRVDLNVGGVTIQTNPEGLSFSLDGGAFQTTPATLYLAPGSHTLAVSATQAGTPGTQYVFSSWSDGGAASHTITVGSAAATYTAAFQTQYQLTTAASPASGGSVTPASGGFYNAGTTVNITATSASGYSFTGWTGSVANASSPSTTIAMSAPETVTAAFGTVSIGFSINPASANVGASVGTGSVAVTATLPTASWTAVSNSSFLTITSGASGTGSGTVGYSVAANTTGSARTGTLTIAGQTFTVNQSAVSTAGLGFYPVAPCRVVDTRAGQGFTGQFGPPSMTAGQTRSFAVPASGCNIPASAQAYSLNVTVVPATTLGYLSIWPAGQSQPYVSTLNSLNGAVLANAAIVPAGANGAVSVYVTDATDLIIDINGYFAPPTSSSLAFYPATPCRVADTRNANGPFGGPSLAAGGSRSFSVPSSSCGIPSTAQAYSLNVTVVPPGPLTYLTTWPTGESQPNVSTLNALQGQIAANAAIVPAGANGAISVFVSDPSNVIIDINGYFAPPGAGALYFYPLTPCRIADTRNANGTFGGPSLGAGATRTFPVPSSACSVPAAAQAYSLNMTVVPPGSLLYLSTWPAGVAQPVVSTLNDLQGQVVANAAIVPAGTGSSVGAIAVYVSDPTNLVIDINGYFGQ